jgi:nucleotide-binding universal stress UspA family protein
MSDELIIGYEDTPEGADALALGGELARALELTALIAKVISVSEGVLSDTELAAALRAAAASELAGPQEQLAPLAAETEMLASTSAARALNDLATDRDAPVLVVGSSGRGPVGRLLGGSTAQRLLHGAPCAVAVAARGFAAEGRRVLRLAVAYDGSPEAEAALHAAIVLERRSNATLTLFTVAHTGASLAASGMPAPAAEFEPGEKRRMREILERGRDRVPPDLPVRTQLLHGSPGELLAEVSGDYDLMLVGSRGYGPLRGTLLGSTSRHLFTAAACSMMALPRGAEADFLER